jgi:hypothetical protein
MGTAEFLGTKDLGVDPAISRLGEKKASRGMVRSAFGSGWPTHIQCGNGTVYVGLKNTRFLTERTFDGSTEGTASNGLGRR